MTPGRITQETAARLMYAHAKVVEARIGRAVASHAGDAKLHLFAIEQADAAEAAFAELVSAITQHEAE
jgi:hypothetical protein